MNKNVIRRRPSKENIEENLRVNIMIPKGNSDPIVEAFLENPYKPNKYTKNRMNLEIKSNIRSRTKEPLKHIDNRLLQEPNGNERYF